jgi:hypothetical protein
VAPVIPTPNVVAKQGLTKASSKGILAAIAEKGSALTQAELQELVRITPPKP